MSAIIVADTNIQKGGCNVKKINWKILNLAFWTEIILSYLLPFHITDNSQYQVGFPIPFISLNAARLNISPFMSMHLNPLGLLFNIIVFYVSIIFIKKVYQKIRQDMQNNS